ncbi:MAG TPA: hypothetical protein ENJ09_03100 [Planctomycetes bacterium]|nr:hypothetical protein [Planctomycetota bacterium]
MILNRRPLLSLLSLTVVLALPASGQDVQADFQRGVELLSQGKKEEALRAFQAVLAADPSREDVYELWHSTDRDVWADLLGEGGQTELVARRIMELAAAGRAERSRDEEAIRAKLAAATSDDVVERTKAVAELAAQHGAYAVPYMVHALGDQANEDRRVLTMQALTRMGADVVPPLIASLESPDAFLRRNVALTLGYIGDSRACAALAMHAFGDEDPPVRTAASQALERCGGSTDVVGQYLALGDAYYAEDLSVLGSGMTSDDLWDWRGAELVATPTPRFLLGPELAQAAYRAALDADPGNAHALAGICRCVVTEKGRLDQWVALGQDAGDWADRIDSEQAAVALAGAAAQDLALGMSLAEGDELAAAGLARALGMSAASGTDNLRSARDSGLSGAVRGEAALALARLDGGSCDGATIAALTEAAGRRILRIAAVVDGDSARREALASALHARGFFANAWPTGGRALGALRSVPGIDVVLVADQLPDMTMDQVVSDLKRDPRTQNVPIFVITSGDDLDFGDRVAGAIGGAADLDSVDEAVSASEDFDRMRANDLAARSARALWHVGMLGADVSSSAGALAGALEGRPDEVTQGALGALGVAGGAAETAAIAAVLADGGRAEELRVAAADALSGIFGRNPEASSDVIEALRAALGDESASVATAAANALGRLDLAGEMRTELVRATDSRR